MHNRLAGVSGHAGCGVHLAFLIADLDSPRTRHSRNAAEPDQPVTVSGQRRKLVCQTCQFREGRQALKLEKQFAIDVWWPVHTLIVD